MSIDADTTHYVISSWGNGAPELMISLPGTWRTDEQQGPDFTLYWFMAPDETGNVGFYIGLHPNLRKSESAKKSIHHVIGKKTEFYSEKKGQSLLTQGIIEGLFAGDKSTVVADLKLHIMINEYSKNFTQNAFTFLATLRIKENR